jgi:hypothetical protein
VSIEPKLCGDYHHALFVLSGVRESLHRDVLAVQDIAIAAKSQKTISAGQSTFGLVNHLSCPGRLRELGNTISCSALF